jgi:ABC-2 type transport system permease protein
VLIAQVSEEEYSIEAFMLISFSLLIIQLIFLSLGIVVSVLIHKIKSVIAVSLGTVFTFFVIGMISSTSGDEAKRYLSPFKYFDHTYIIQNSSYETSFLIVAGSIITVCLITSILVYKRRDIHAV